MSSDLPSPTKKPSLEAPEEPEQDPTDIRGSMSKQARTGFESSISWRATQARAAVNKGHTLPPAPNTRRPLGYSRTEPSLSFSNSPSNSSFNSSNGNAPTRFPPFQTSQDFVNLVYTNGKRPNEIQPFGETGSDFGSRANSRSGSGIFGTERGGFGTTASVGAVSMQDEDGDGFDLDQVYGESATSFRIPPFGGSQGDSQDSTRTVTQRMKRVFEGEDSGTTLVEEEGTEEDDDMVATDVEDEGEDQVSSTMPNMFGSAGGARKIAGARRTFGKTQSLPASAFQGQMEF